MKPPGVTKVPCFLVALKYLKKPPNTPLKPLADGSFLSSHSFLFNESLQKPKMENNPATFAKHRGPCCLEVFVTFGNLGGLRSTFLKRYKKTKSSASKKLNERSL